MSTPSGSSALEAIDRILNRGGDADDVLRAVVAALHERGGYAWAGILFVEGDRLVLGPEAGEPDPARRRATAVLWQGARIAELAVDGGSQEDEALLERVAVLLSGHCLVGWDTGGAAWES